MLRSRGMIIWLLCAGLLPSGASAAVPRPDSGTLAPRNGAELLEAAAIATAEANASDIGPAIRLEPKTYVVDRTVVLGGGWEPAVISAPEGATITNAGAPFTLLRIWSRGEPYVGLDGGDDPPARLRLELTGSTTAAFPVVELQSGGSLLQASVAVGADTPNVTGVRMVPALGRPTNAAPSYRSVLSWSDVTSDAAAAPAISASPGALLNRVDAEGGQRTLSIGEDAADSTLDEVTVAKTTLAAGPSTSAVVRAAATVAPLRATFVSTELFSDADAPALSVAGASAAIGTLAVRLQNSTVIGPASGPQIAVTPDRESTATTVDAAGLLSLDSPEVVSCPATAPVPAQIRITTSYREGALGSGAACTITETARVTGDPAFVDRDAGDLRPRWGSSLIDTTSPPPPPFDESLFWFVDRDLAFGERRVAAGGVAARALASGAYGRTDTGALEYQNTPPANVGVDTATFGNRGLVGFATDAFDPDPDEDQDLTFEWTFPDGSTQAGDVALYRFAPGEDNLAVLKVTDVTGFIEEVQARGYPQFFLDEEPTDDPDYIHDPGWDDLPLLDDEELGEVGDLLPPITLPTRPPSQRPTPTTPTPPVRAAAPAPTPVLGAVTLLSSRIKTSRKLAPGFGRARSGEAALVINTTRKAPMRLEAASLVKGNAVPIAGAVQSLRAFTGKQTLRVGARIGKARLKPGLYRLTVIAAPEGRPEERRSVTVRVVRAKR